MSDVKQERIDKLMDDRSALARRVQTLEQDVINRDEQIQKLREQLDIMLVEAGEGNDPDVNIRSMRVTEVRRISSPQQEAAGTAFVNVRGEVMDRGGDTGIIHSIVFRINTSEAKDYPVGTVLDLTINRRR